MYYSIIKQVAHCDRNDGSWQNGIAAHLRRTGGSFGRRLFIRFPLQNRGKSGSVRVCYTDFAEYEVIYLITAFQKKSQENLTEEEKSILKKLVKSLREEAAKNRR